MAYPYFGNNQYYMQDLQQMRDRIDQQLRQAQQFQQPQMQQTPAINQTFQLAPNSIMNDLDAKYASNIDEAKNTLALKTTLFIDRENKNLWIKGTDGNIKTYTLTEVVELDEKDKQILALQQQIQEMKGMMINAKQSDNINVNESDKIERPAKLSKSKSINE